MNRNPRALLWLATLLGFLLAIQTQALEPHEILLLVNDRSERSKQVANEYVHLRHIPEVNIVYLPLPDKVLEPEAEFSLEEFRDLVWNPAHQTLKDRGLESRILAWVYSLDFPVRITTTPAISLQGATFLNGTEPVADAVTKGAYASPLFGGPDKPGGPAGESRDLRWFKSQIGDAMPTPSMMLGFAGSRGNSVDTILGGLRNATRADRSFPSGNVYYVTNNDVRSHCRAWQYPAAAAELANLNVVAQIVPRVPDGARMIGVFAGTPAPTSSFEKNAEYIPGCIMEHLTSAAGIFHIPEQLKMTLWIDNGAAATAGTVAEPMAIWTKFPNARFFAHYARGLTVLESFFLSIRCPLQILLLGDPLCRPFSPSPGLELTHAVVTNGVHSFTLEHSAPPPPDMHYSVLLDGYPLPEGSEVSQDNVRIPATAIASGYHELRAFGYRKAPPFQHAYAQRSFHAGNTNRTVHISQPAEGSTIDITHGVEMRVSADPTAIKVGIAHNGRVLLESEGAETEDTVDLSPEGSGILALRPYARYADGQVVYGAPVMVNVQHLNKPPALNTVGREKGGKMLILTPNASDPEGDPLHFSWFQPLTMTDKNGVLSGGQLEPVSNTVRFTPANAYDTYVLSEARETLPASVSCDICVNPLQWDYLQAQILGLVFNYRGPQDFAFFGLAADRSAWVLGEYRNGTLIRRVSRGAPVLSSRWYQLGVTLDKSGCTATVDGRNVCVLADLKPEKRPVGILTGGAAGFFRNLMVSPPMIPSGMFRLRDNAMQVSEPGKSSSPPAQLILRVSDPEAQTETTVDLNQRAP